jgi:hypothetical protein
MPKPHHDIYNSDPGTLEQLLGLESCARHDASQTDCDGCLGHTLSLPLVERLADTRPDWATALEDLCTEQEPPIKTVRDLLLHPSPPVGVLIILKNAAKSSRARPGGPLADRAATALYLAAIGVAWYRCHEVITTLDIHGFAEKLHWAADQPWDDPTMVAVLKTTADEIQATPQY